MLIRFYLTQRLQVTLSPKPHEVPTKGRLAIGGKHMWGKGRSGGLFSERQCCYVFESFCKKWDKSANCRRSSFLGWRAVMCLSNWCTGCNGWQLPFHSGTSQTANFAVICIWTSAAGYTPLLLFARRQDKHCACNVILRSVHATTGGFAVFGRVS